MRASAQVPPVPDIAEPVDSIFAAMGDLAGSLAPDLEFDVDSEAYLCSSGASMQDSGTYSCDESLALDEVLRSRPRAPTST